MKIIIKGQPLESFKANALDGLFTKTSEESRCMALPKGQCYECSESSPPNGLMVAEACQRVRIRKCLPSTNGPWHPK